MSEDPNLLQKIRERPGLYLGECSLSALYYTLGGYDMALGIHRIAEERALRLPDDFHDWVAYRLHYASSTSGWRRMILESTGGNEAAAFARFFELLDDHAARRSRVVAKLQGVQKTYTTSSGGHEWTERYPTSISLIAYTDDPGLFAVSDEPGYTLPGTSYCPSLRRFLGFTDADRSRFTIVDPSSFERWLRQTET